MTKPRLLVCGDFACHTGFARVNESIAWHLRDRWDIAVLGVNYHGSYTPLQRHYHLHPAWIGGDAYGHGHIAKVADVERPDVILVVADPWHAGPYIEALSEREPPWTPTLLYTPVDATGIKHADGESLNGYDHVIAYTQFGARELRKAGCRTPLAVIPHGIMRDLFRPIDRSLARQQIGIPDDWFVVLIVERNQPRKRLDIAFDAFAQFAADRPEARLLYHGALTEETGWDIEAMAVDLGIADRLIITSRDVGPTAGFPPHQLPYLYSLADIKLSTTSGEGWGLTTMEAMACGVPCLVPDYAALGEWAKGAASLMPAPIATRHVKINTVGRVPLVTDVVDNLDYLYQHPEWRAELREKGLQLVSDPAYDWAHIADQFDTLLRRAMWRDTRTQVTHRARIEELADAS